MIRNTPSSWGNVARSFHWIPGFVIIGMIAYGWWMNDFWHHFVRRDRVAARMFDGAEG
jgi:cytochrome b561